MEVIKIVKWIKKKVKEANACGCVVGLSGGIDSAVVAALCKKAVGKNLLCLILPCQSAKFDVDDAIFLAKKFKLKTRIIDLSPTYIRLLKSLPNGTNKIAKANIIPRLRMTTLYYFANLLNYLVVGTGNKSEISVGYFTKYGDGGVDILPLGNFYKSEVKQLAYELNIPEKIIQKIPTAGLWKGQTDEGEMGFTYDELEKVLRSYEKSRKIPRGKIGKMLKNSEHKRKMPEIYNKG